MNLARTTGCSKIEINSDRMEVVEALKEGYSSSVASCIFDDCYFMSLDFSHIVFKHCYRENNKVAHELARLARFTPPDVWMEAAPMAVVPLLVSDATIVAR